MSIGAKTVTSVMLLVLALSIASSRDRLRADYLAQLDPWVAFLAGLLAVIAGTAVFRFWRLWDRSEFYLRFFGSRSRWVTDGSLAPRRSREVVTLGRGAKGITLELPGPVQQLIYLAIFFWVGLITLDNRAISLLADYPRKISQSSANYCPDQPSPDDSAKDPTKQGCALIRRAYQLGYADSLGSCAEEEKDDEAVEPCRLRQADEPYLHYAWRLLVDRGRSVIDIANPGRWRDLGGGFEDEWNDLDSVLWTRYDAVAATPRSSHHLFTTLPAPRPLFRLFLPDYVARQIDRVGCIKRASRMPHRLTRSSRQDPTLAASEVVEHVLDQLLFNPIYQTVVGFCREYTIHWNAPSDACARLAQHPEQFLAEAGALDNVREVLARRHHRLVMSKIAARAAERAGQDPGQGRDIDRESSRKLPPAQRIVSFQCLVVDRDRAEKRAPIAERDQGGPRQNGPRLAVGEHELVVDGHEFQARELHVPSPSAGERGQIELYHQLAMLLARGFRYGRLVSRESVATGETSEHIANVLAQPSYLFTKLELLRDADLFLGHEWIDGRPDLLDVYPYHLHLNNFVNLFRQYYQRERGRL
ncbi:MAG: hypothetical protein MJE77_38130 [Proteobacteria bacterium]|nr:hypothetical protein [Pseudomonadota bacterium]